MENGYPYRWLALAVAFLGIGGLFALLIALSRTPFGHSYFPPDFLHKGLVGHVVLAIVLWLMSFAVALWGFFLSGPQSRLSPVISLVGGLVITASVLSGRGDAIANNYVPAMNDPLFFIGLAVFFMGFAINAVGYLKYALKNIFGSDPLKSALGSSVALALIMLASFAVSLATLPDEPAMLMRYERLFWIPGHVQQVLNGALLIAVWHALAAAISKEGAKPFVGMGFFNCLLLLSAAALFAIPLFLDPLERTSKIIAEIIYGVGLGAPIFAHAMNILRSLKRAALGKSVAQMALLLSMSIYFLGVAIAYGGFGDDLRVPAHYHGAVTGLTLAMMGFSYHLLKNSAGERGYVKKLAIVQPWLYGFGMVLFILGLMVSGALGAPRKTHGVAFTSDPLVLSALTVMGIGTLLAVCGGVLFVYCSTVLLIRRKNVA